MDDDHYIPFLKNAHIDTTSFQNGLREEIIKNPAINDETLAGIIYDRAIAKIIKEPSEPSENALICRYLTPAKFIKFIDSRQIDFTNATQFSDKWECVIPEDYNNAVLAILGEFNRSGTAWGKHVRNKASSWYISCWTQLEEYFDDHLMWVNYAGGSDGIGITIRYSQLKAHIPVSLKTIDSNRKFQSGLVNYYQNQTISLLPFNKHPMFKNEKEVRFAFCSVNAKLEPISVEDIFSMFGVRISPAAKPEYAELIRRIWCKYGGADRIQHPE